ncbi:MAG: hypothetical protein P8181_02670 [bacterium]
MLRSLTVLRVFCLLWLSLCLLPSCDTADRPAMQSPVAGDSGGRVGSFRDAVVSTGPFLEVTIPACADLNPALVPPVTTYEWQTLDGAQDPDSVQWALVNAAYFNDSFDQTLDYIRNNPDAPEWHSWCQYNAPNDSGKFWTTPPVDFGRYVFAVHGWDVDTTACQEFEFGRNAVRVRVSQRTTGPLLTVDSDILAIPLTTATINTPVMVVNLPAGTPAEFCWTADASAYCGVVIAYRYGWDIPNASNDAQWDVGWTPFDGSETCSPARIFYFGTHTFYVDVLDNSGLISRIPVKINYTPEPVMLRLDLLPGTCPNELNPWSRGALWAALLGSTEFDVTEIDLETVTLTTADYATDGVKPGQHRIWDSSTPSDGSMEPDCTPSGTDGFDDLNLKFDLGGVADLVGPGSMGDEVRLVLTGLMTDGTPFSAEDRVRIVGVDIEEPPGEPHRGPDTEILQVVNTYFVGYEEHQEVIDIFDSIPDTVPFGSWIRIDYRGIPDTDTSACFDPINECIGYQKKFTWSSSQNPGLGETISWLPSYKEETNYFGTTDSTTMNAGSAEYLIKIRAVDAFNRPDLTPAAVRVFGNLSPALDSLGIGRHDGTVIGDGDSVVWDWWNPANFHGNSADTLDLSDPPNIWIVRDFCFLVRGFGHDDPKDGANSGVKSWLYSFTRSEDPAFVQPFARSGYWVDGATVNALSDTVWLHVRYSFLDDPGGQQAFANLPDWVHRSYDFSIRGRDTGLLEEFQQFMYVNGDKWLINRFNVGALGRETGTGTMSFHLTITR